MTTIHDVSHSLFTTRFVTPPISPNWLTTASGSLTCWLNAKIRHRRWRFVGGFQRVSLCSSQRLWILSLSI